MKAYLVAVGCALVASSASVLAQGEAPAPACYIEVQRLMAEPPEGIGELGAAIRQLDATLRPQVAEINALKAQLARLEQREVQSAPSTSIEAAFAEDDGEPRQAALAADDPTAEEIRRVQAELDALQARLKLDYAAQQQALIGPVQARVSRGAQFFATTNGCAEMKMARAPDLPTLASAGARNMTGEFVAWYLSDQPG